MCQYDVRQGCIIVTCHPDCIEGISQLASAVNYHTLYR